MPWHSLALFLGFTVVAQYHGVQALRGRNDATTSLNELLALGIFAGRDRFTQAGWRHRRLAITLQLLGFAVAVFAWVASGR
jgi:hypothetical protein